MPTATAAPAIEDRRAPRAPAWVSVLGLAWPAITHMLLVTIVFAADRLFAARIGDAALASLQISTVLVWAATTVFAAVGVGVGALVGKAVGAGDREATASVIRVGLVVAIAVGVGAGAGLWIAGPSLLAWAFDDAGPAALFEAQRYLDVFVWVLPLGFVETVGAAALSASGNTRTPLYAGALGNALGLAVAATTALGLFGAPMLGTRGLALGSACAYVIAVAVLVAKLPGAALRVGLRGRDRRALRDVLVIAGPAVVDKLVYAGGYVVFAVLLGTLGTAAMAANQAVVSLDAIAFLTAEGFGVAAMSLVSRQLGADQREWAAYSARSAIALAVVALSLFGLVFVLVPRSVLGPLCPDAEVLAAAEGAMPYAALAQPFIAFAVAGRMALRGAGHTKEALLSTALGTLLVRLPLAAWVVSRPGATLAELWAVAALDWVVEALVVGWMLQRRSVAVIRVAAPKGAPMGESPFH